MTTKMSFIMDCIYNNTEIVTSYSKQTEVLSLVKKIAEESNDEKISGYVISQGDISKGLAALGYYRKKFFIAPPDDIAHKLNLLSELPTLVQMKITYAILFENEANSEIIIKVNAPESVQYLANFFKKYYKANIFIFTNSSSELLIKYISPINDDESVTPLKENINTTIKSIGIYLNDRLN